MHVRVTPSTRHVVSLDLLTVSLLLITIINKY